MPKIFDKYTIEISVYKHQKTWEPLIHGLLTSKAAAKVLRVF